MANDVLESIATNVLSTLQGVTTGGGYNYTLSVSREMKTNAPAHLKTIIFQDDPYDDPEAESQDVRAWVQTFNVIVFVMPTDSDTTPIATYYNLIAADISKALMSDPTRAGLANDTIVMPQVAFDHVSGQASGIAVNFEVHYRTLRGDPYTAAA